MHRPTQRLIPLLILLLILLAACAKATPAAPTTHDIDIAQDAASSNPHESATPAPIEEMPADHAAGVLPDTYVGLTSPIPADAASLTRGKVLFIANCARCHGEDATGNGPDAATLSSSPKDLVRLAQFLNEGYLMWKIDAGSFGTDMPGFAETLEEQERWDILNYIISLGADGSPS